MSTVGVHRIIERQAAINGDQVAIFDDTVSLTYRELNQRANAVARALMARGLRRGAHVLVRLDRGPDLAIVLLAVLKAGAAYTWIDATSDSVCPYGISIVMEESSPRPLVIDPAQVLSDLKPAPNLPIVTRSEDIACALPQEDGRPGSLIPHAMIASLHSQAIQHSSRWTGDAAAIDLWVPLMAGATVTVDAAPAQIAAA